MKGQIAKGLAAGGAIRVVSVDATELARRTAQLHALSGASAQIAAEGSLALCLLSAYIKGSERISLQLQTEEPRLAFTGDFDAIGTFRARLTPSRLPPGTAEQMAGVMLVIKSDSQRELYRGATEVILESLSAAVQRHLQLSTQVTGEAVLSVEMDDDEVAFAGGVWVERLPEDTSRPSIDVEEFAARVRPLRELDARGLLTELAAGKLLDMAYEELDVQHVDWTCRCSRERVAVMLQGLGPAEVRDMIETDGGAEVICHFCTTAYAFDEADLQAMLPVSES